jgi:hypothetical protein
MFDKCSAPSVELTVEENIPFGATVSNLTSNALGRISEALASNLPSCATNSLLPSRRGTTPTLGGFASRQETSPWSTKPPTNTVPAS